MQLNTETAKMLCVVLILLSNYCNAREFTPSHIDLTIVGPIDVTDSLGRLSLGVADIVKNELHINHSRVPGDYILNGISPDLKSIIENPDKTPGNIAILNYSVYWNKINFSDYVPETSYIKIAYSMIESTAIPQEWVSILNEKFDLVVVPDEFYQEVYANSGVSIPIFALPHGVFIEELLKETSLKKESGDFVFGCNSVLFPRKNQHLLIEAFHKEFAHEPNVKLKLHGKWAHKTYLNAMRQQLEQFNNTSIELVHFNSSEAECLDFYRSLDCYVLVSKGEGFSMTPREALAAGIPCILSNNTAHKTIIDSGYVYPVPSDIKLPADYLGHYGKADCGYQFDCKCEDVQKALREVYKNYTYYKDKAKEGKIWVQQYLWKNLKPKFLNLFKPKKVILGDRDIITNEYIMTRSQALFKKYSVISNESR